MSIDITSIPTVQEKLKEIANLYPPTPEILENSAKLAHEHGGLHALEYALLKGDWAEADRVMAEKGWTPTSFPDPDATNDQKDATLIFKACWGNSGKINPAGSVLRLYEYLVACDPQCVFSPDPYTGGNMLHAWMVNPTNENLIILKNLLARGVDPFFIDKKGRTPLMRLEEEHIQPALHPTEEFLELKRTLPELLAKKKEELRREVEAKFGKDDPRAQKFLADTFENYDHVVSYADSGNWLDILNAAKIMLEEAMAKRRASSADIVVEKPEISASKSNLRQHGTS